MRLRPLPLLIAVAVLAAAAAVLNPSAEQHRAKIRASIAERSTLAKVLRLGHLAAFVSEYHSLGVASYTKANERLLSVGAFGLVVVMEPEPAR